MPSQGEEYIKVEAAGGGDFSTERQDSVVIQPDTLPPQSYQSGETKDDDFVEVLQKPNLAPIVADKVVVQLKADDLKNLIESLIEARVEARLKTYESQQQPQFHPQQSPQSQPHPQPNSQPQPQTQPQALSQPQSKPIDYEGLDPVMDSFGSVMSVDNFAPPPIRPKPRVAFKEEEQQQGEKLSNLTAQQKSVVTLQDILSDDDEAYVPPLSNHDELTRCFECGRKHMTPNGLFMHLNKVHPKSQQISRLKSTTWCPLCVVNCRHWYNMAMHVQEIHGQRCWWLEKEVSEVRVQSMTEGLTRAEVLRPQTPSLKRASRGRVRQASVVEYPDIDEEFLPDQYNVDDSLFATDSDQIQEPLDRKSSFQGFQPVQRQCSLELWDEEMKPLNGRMKQPIQRECSLELWDDEMKSLDGRMKQIMENA